MDSIIELMNAISEMYQAKTDNSQIYQSLGTNRERLIHKSDIFTPTNHKDRAYNMFDPTTKSNVTQPLSKRTLNGLTVGDQYLPKYSKQGKNLKDKLKIDKKAAQKLIFGGPAWTIEHYVSHELYAGSRERIFAPIVSR